MKAALGFVKITIGVLPEKELASHVEDLVRSTPNLVPLLHSLAHPPRPPRPPSSPDTLSPQVSTILSWGENTKNHFRLKARVILERLMRKFRSSHT